MLSILVIMKGMDESGSEKIVPISPKVDVDNSKRVDEQRIGRLRGLLNRFRSKAKSKDQDSTQQEAPENGEPASNKLKSPYFESAMHTVREEIPEKAREIAGVLTSTDDQMGEHLTVFKSQKFPGVVVPYSWVSVNEVIAGQFGAYQTNDLPKKSRKEIVFPGFSRSPAGHPYTAGDIVYDRVIGAIPEVVGPVRRSKKTAESIPEAEIISFGSPNGMGGRVTQEWVDGLKKSGFDQYAQLYDEMVKSLVGAEDSEIVFNGMSMGATVAEKTARDLASWKAIKVIMDNPVTNHGSIARIWKALQIPVGFAGEGGLKMGFSKNMRMERAAEAEFNNEYRKVLAEKGISATDSDEQSALKGDAVRTDIIMLVKGSPLDTGDVRRYIRRGVGDPTTISPINLARVFSKAAGYKMSEQEKLFTGEMQNTHGIIRGKTKSAKVEEYAISSTHFINRLRVGKWARVIDMAKDIDKPFKEPKLDQA